MTITADTARPSALPALSDRPLSNDAFGALINLSGRRRFTSQRLVLYAVLAAQQQPEALDTAREALELFRTAHDALIGGKDGMAGVFCEELREAYFGETQGDQQIRGFIKLADAALDAIEHQTPRAPALLAELVQSATPILRVLNRITLIYEEQSKRQAIMLKKQLHSTMTDLEAIAKQARLIAFNARIVAARAGDAGKEFSVVAGVLSNVTTEIDELVRQAVGRTAA